MSAVVGTGGALRSERPTSLDEARDVLDRAAAEGARVLFRGGGTELGLGGPVRDVDVVLETEGLDRVVEYSPLDQVVVAEAGVRLGTLQALLATKGQMLALDAPWADRATLGGVLCTNAFGPRRTRYGSVRDLVIGVSMVRADGTVAKGGGKVVKNVAGFDLPKLMVGSLGTLGLVATVTFRLHPLPEATATVALAGVDADAVRRLVLAMRQAQLEPDAVVALLREGGADLGVRFDARFDVAVRFEGFGSGVEQQTAKLLALATRNGWTAERLDDLATRAFWARHAEAREAPAAFRAKLASLPTDVERLSAAALGALYSVLERPRGVLYPTLGLGFVVGDPRPGKTPLNAAVVAAREALPKGTLVVHAAPAEAWTSGLDGWGPPPAALPLLASVKDRFDPGRRLAPGRFVGGL